MNATSPRIKTSLIAFLAVLALGSFTTASANSGSDNTASYVKARIDKYDGKSVSLDVAMVRLLRPYTTDENFVLLGASTVDDENHSSGGGILVVANKADKDMLINRYGTTIDHDRGQGVDSKSMRGVIHLVNIEGKRKFIYLDLTNGAFDPSEAGLRELSQEDADVSGAVMGPVKHHKKGGKGF